MNNGKSRARFEVVGEVEAPIVHSHSLAWIISPEHRTRDTSTSFSDPSATRAT
jgi:hypothetical protein